MTAGHIDDLDLGTDRIPAKHVVRVDLPIGCVADVARITGLGAYEQCTGIGKRFWKIFRLSGVVDFSNAELSEKCRPCRPAAEQLTQDTKSHPRHDLLYPG